MGGAGFDVADYSNSGGSVVVSLRDDNAEHWAAEGDVLIGIEGVLGSGNADTLVGDDRDNILDGAGGNDALVGLKGDDIYRFGLGDGVDIVHERDQWFNPIAPVDRDSWGQDSIEFKSGISFTDLTFLRTGLNHLYINIKGASDQLQIWNWYMDEADKIETLSFDNGMRSC